MVDLCKCKRCGNKDVVIEEDTRLYKGENKTLYYAICNNLGCGLATQYFQSKNEASRNWNYWNTQNNTM